MPIKRISMERPKEVVWMGPQVGWDQVSVNHHSQANSVNQVNGDSDMVSVLGGRGEAAQERKNGLY